MYIIFEGLDKTGKTKCMKVHLGKLNKWKDVSIDRGPVGYMFYDNLFDRKTIDRFGSYTRDLHMFMNNVNFKVVFLKSDPQDIKDRHTSNDSVFCNMPNEEIETLQNKYETMCNEYYGKNRVNVINTSIVKEKDMVNKLNEVLYDWGEPYYD